ncbi:MAG: hypothetical protein ACJ76V_15640 [Thermoleophilaceae bacterium]
MAYDWRTEWPGVFAHHADSCPVRNGRRCTCGPLGYRANAREPETGRRVLSPTFDTVAEARAWQSDQQEALEAARGVPRDDGDLGAVIDDFIAAAQNGLARDGGGVEYSPDRVRELRESLGYVDAQLGTMKIQDVRRRHVQGLVDQLRLSGVESDRVEAVVDALRSLYIYAIQREEVDFSPVVLLSLSDSPNGRPSQAQTESLRTTAFAQPAPPAISPAPPAFTPAPLPAPQPTMATMPATGTAQPAAAPTSPMSTVAEKYYEALTPERVLWWTVLIIVIVSVLIAIVLAAESV